jgi:hypothetical protein
MIETLSTVIKRSHCRLDEMLTRVHSHVTDPPSLRHIEAMMVERGVFVDHASIHQPGAEDSAGPATTKGCNAVIRRSEFRAILPQSDEAVAGLRR